MKMPVRLERVFDNPDFSLFSHERLAVGSGVGGGTISTASSPASSVDRRGVADTARASGTATDAGVGAGTASGAGAGGTAGADEATGAAGIVCAEDVANPGSGPGSGVAAGFEAAAETGADATADADADVGAGSAVPGAPVEPLAALDDVGTAGAAGVGAADVSVADSATGASCFWLDASPFLNRLKKLNIVRNVAVRGAAG